MNAGIFHEPPIDFKDPSGHTPRPMTPAPVAILVVCVVVVSVVLISTLLALRKTALRAENVLSVVEQGMRPMLGQLEALIAELRDLSQGANEELSKIRVVVRRAEDVSITVSKAVVAVGGLTRFGQYVSLALGVKKGLEVFVRRLKATR
jgi:uncharacterized protein YoxC